MSGPFSGLKFFKKYGVFSFDKNILSNQNIYIERVLFFYYANVSFVDDVCPPPGLLMSKRR